MGNRNVVGCAHACPTGGSRHSGWVSNPAMMARVGRKWRLADYVVVTLGTFLPPVAVGPCGWEFVVGGAVGEAVSG